MTFQLSSFVRLLDRLYNGIAVLAGTAILVAVILTFTDVLLRFVGRLAVIDSGLRKSWGLSGLIDLTQLAILTAAALSIAFGFWRGSHVFVDILIVRFSPANQRLVKAVSGLLGTGLMFSCFWFGLAEMRRQLDFSTTSATLGIPFTWYWAPLLTGLFLAAFAVLVRTIDMLQRSSLLTSMPGQADEKLLSVDTTSWASKYD